jgi:hypothetical protein
VSPFAISFLHKSAILLVFFGVPLFSFRLERTETGVVRRRMNGGG